MVGQRNELFDLGVEYIVRDLLNRILDNSDNHSRNISIIRAAGKLRLAHIYDLAPMVLDPEGITRVTNWEHDSAGAPDGRQSCHDWAGDASEDLYFDALLSKTQDFRALPDLLVNSSESVRNANSIPLDNLDARLKEWGLI